MVNEYKPDYGYKPQTIEHVSAAEHYRQEPPKKKNKFVEHYKRFWWAHLISICIGTIIVTCLLMFVGLPNIAQDGINKAELSLLEQIITEPTPSSVHMFQTAKSISHSPFHPWLGAFNASLFLENTIDGPNIKPFGIMTVPRMKATKEAMVTVNQTLQILDMEQFIAYNTLVTQADKFRVALRGRTSLKQPGLPTVYVDFNKVLEMKGLNSLAGLRVMNTKFMPGLANFPDGSTMHGQIYIPNPSKMTITLGDVIQDLFVDNIPIGNTTIPNLVLAPGDNLFNMVSTSDKAAVITLLTTKYKDGVLPVTAICRSVTYMGRHLPYFEAAMKATPVRTSLDLLGPLKEAGLDLAAALNAPAPTGGTTGGTTGGAAAAPPAAPKAATPKAAGPVAAPAPAPAAAAPAAAAPVAAPPAAAPPAAAPVAPAPAPAGGMPALQGPLP